ncbi:MAG: hypothetical protein WB507_10135 [Solirubrobacterales bacterium]
MALPLSASAAVSHVFKATFGGPPATSTNPYPLGSPSDVAVDQSNGDVYVANPGANERQAVTVTATGGTYNLGFEGKVTGATGNGNLSAATGEGSFSAATGEGTLSYAFGVGCTTSIPDVITFETHGGAFAVGQRIEGLGMPSGTTIEAVGPGNTLTISVNLMGAGGSCNEIFAASDEVTGLTTQSGAFAVGQRIEGSGIPTGTTIKAVGPGTLTLSQLPTITATGVSLTAGSNQVTGLTTSTGAFSVGELIQGVGLPANTTITAIGPGTLELSSLPTESASAVSLSAALPYNAPPPTLQGALEGLSTIGIGNVSVTEEAGVYIVTFVQALGKTDVKQITAEASGLTGGTATVTTAAPGTAGYDVEKFNEKGEFLLMFGKDVNKHGNTEAERDVCTKSEECQPGEPAEGPGALELPSVLAVDNSCNQQEPPLTGVACEAFDPSVGDVYVADRGDNLVSKFDASGHIITSWGADGQKNGSDATDLPNFGPLLDVAVNAEGDLYVTGAHYSYSLWRYTQAGAYIPPAQGPRGNSETFFDGVFIVPSFALDPSNGEVYSAEAEPEAIGHSECFLCETLDTFGAGDLSGAAGIAVDGASGNVYAANSTGNDVAVFADARPIVTILPPEEVTESAITLVGQIEPAGRGEITSCHFEYGFDRSYGTTLPCSPPIPPNLPNSASEPTKVTAKITGLVGGTQDHYRLVVTNSAEATRKSSDRTFITTQPPSIDGLRAEDLTATTAQLIAKVNPNGLDTTYKVEYGVTTQYGQVAPEHEVTLEASNSDQTVEIPLSNLTPNVVYHYTLVATNEDGTTIAEDHTFNFYPPSCPNENVRQQSQANYLPDCRAYELVSPGNAGGTFFYPGGPNTGYAASPARFSFTGRYSTVPGSGGSPIDNEGDLYVATRTDTGWVTKYVGLPANEVAVDGGPQMGPPVSAGVVGAGLTGLQGSEIGRSNEANGAPPYKIQNNVLTDPAMDTFADWDDGNIEAEGASNAPYVWSADGRFLERWPTNLSIAPGGHYLAEEGKAPVPTAGGVHALDCLNVVQGGFRGSNLCPGDVTASSDLSHFVFATEWSTFASEGSEGQVTPPGSVYDNNTVTKSVDVASKLAGGAPIPAEPTDEAGDTLQIPAVSSNGSHILMAAGAVGPCGSAQCPEVTHCESTFRGVVSRCQLQSSHLYMRVGDAVTYDVSQGHDVTYVGMTPDGSKVYFTSEEHLTGEDPDHGGTSLYMWSEATNSLTLISKASPGSPAGAGNTADCNASFTSQCGIVTYSDTSYCTLVGGAGGNCHSDNAIAAENGDVYFFSPEQLDGTRGVPNHENLYDYRNGAVQYVTTFTTGPFCYQSSGNSACSDTPIARMQVSANDAHMAFVTASPITQYENAGHLEMYTYEPSTRKIVCVSCNPSGAPATSNVEASQDGLFMANDGRTFFSTDEALVHEDSNGSEDVYEYVNGRPQLITPGKGGVGSESEINPASAPGLIGVSANGTDVYFSTLETLVPEDHNGRFIKFYDARSGGGFSAPPPPPSCEAADECHGPGSEPSAALQSGTGAALGAGGNVTQTPVRHHKKRHKRSRGAHRGRATKHDRAGRK